MRKIVLPVIMLLLVTSLPALAVTYSGSLNGGAGGGIIATDGWASASTVFAWVVDDSTNPGYWTYQYRLTVPTKNISHVLLELSLGTTVDDITGATEKETMLYSPDDPGNSNPGLPGAFWAVKIDPIGDATDMSWSFKTIEVPVWGDFYAKDGTDKVGDTKIDVTMWNSAFGTPDIVAVPGVAGPEGKILRPDGEDIPPTPELGTWLLLGLSGLAGGVVYRRRRA